MRLVVLLLALVLNGAASAQSVAHTPHVGSRERTNILAALRETVEPELKQQVRFKVDVFRVAGSWAFLRGTPQGLHGMPIDYRNTPYQVAIEEGAFDDGFSALLRRDGDEWIVVAYSIGATDVVWEGWADEYKAPKAIFE